MIVDESLNLRNQQRSTGQQGKFCFALDVLIYTYIFESDFNVLAIK